MSTIEIKSNVRAMADELVDGYEYNPDTGVVKFKDGDKAVAVVLPEGMSLEQVKDVQAALIDASAAHTLALGEVGQKVLKGQSEVNKITAKTTIGYSAVESTFWKEQSGVTAGKPWKKVGKATTDLTIGTGRKAAPYKDVVKYLAETSESVFAN